jgi:dUTP pyrophosphatase
MVYVDIWSYYYLYYRRCVNIFLKIKRLNKDVKLPTKNHPDDAGYDVYANMCDYILPKQTALIKTGLILDIPSGYEVQIRPRSGLSYRTKIRIANTPGTIDAGYKDELMIILENISDEEGYPILEGDRIAQLVVQKLPEVELVEVEEINTDNNRGGGCGSSGR